MTQPLIRKSRQEWKLFGSFTCLLAGSGAMFYGINQMQNGKDEALFLILFSLTAQIMAGVFACISIRCPKCGLKWVWHAVSKKDMNQWVPWLLSFEECPKCEIGAAKEDHI